MLEEIVLWVVLWTIRDIRSLNCILENSWTHWSFKSWKVNFKTEVCSNSVLPHITLHWIKAVEIAKSIDDLMTLQSIPGRIDFSDYEMLDAKIVSALKKKVFFLKDETDEHGDKGSREGSTVHSAVKSKKKILLHRTLILVKKKQSH